MHLEVMDIDHLCYCLRVRCRLYVSQGASAEKAPLWDCPLTTPCSLPVPCGWCFTVVAKTRDTYPGEAVPYAQMCLFDHKFGLIAICFVLGPLLR